MAQLNREQVIQSAEKLVSRGKVDAAIKEYGRLLDESPGDTSTLNRVGDLWLRLERLDEAKRIFQQTAEAYVEDGFVVKAIAIYKKIIKYDPTNLDAYERLADLYHRQGLINEARSQYQVLADYFLKHGDRPHALAILGKMTTLEPENPWPRAKLADIHQEMGSYEQSLAEHRAVAEILFAQGLGEEAAKVLHKGLLVDPSALVYIEWSVQALQGAGQAGAAARLLATAIDKNPDAQAIATRLGLDRARAVPAAARPSPPSPRATAPIPLQRPVEPRRDPSPPARPVAAPRAALAPSAPPVPLAPVIPVAPPLVASPAAPTPVRAASPEETLAVTPPAAGGPPARLPRVVPPTGDFDSVELEIEGFEDVPPAGEVLPPIDAVAEPPAAALDADGIPWGSSSSWREMEAFDNLAPGEPGGIAAAAAETALRFDPQDLEDTAAQLQSGAGREEDLVAEAEVYARYGLRARAISQLREALQRNPGNVEAYRVLVQIHLEQGRHDRVMEVVRQAQTAIANLSTSEAWRQMRQRLMRLGYQVRGDKVVGAPNETSEETPYEVQQLMQRLVRERPPAPAAAPPVAPSVSAPAPVPEPVTVPAPAADFALELDLDLPELTLEPAAAAPTEPPAAMAPAAPSPLPIAAPPPAASSPAARVISAAPLAGAAASPPKSEAEDLFDDTAVFFLSAAEDLELKVTPAKRKKSAAGGARPRAEQPAAGTPAGAASGKPRPAAEGLFSEEDEFFDLAAELERELAEADRGSAGTPASASAARPTLPSGSLVPEMREQSLEEIVEGFKRGVAEVLSPEDYDTHFNLGIAYREMGLLDEAIGEFQLSAKDPAHLLESCSLLGACFLDKSLPELSVKWYRRALEVPDLPEEQHLAMLYELGRAFAEMDDREQARKTFVEIYGIKSNYRDVVARIEELRR